LVYILASLANLRKDYQVLPSLHNYDKVTQHGTQLQYSLPTDVTSEITLPVICSRLKKHIYFLFLSLHDLVPVPLQFVLT